MCGGLHILQLTDVALRWD